MKLERNKLIEIDDKLQKIEINNVQILEALNEMSNIIDSHEFESDNKFYVFSRRKSLIEQFENNIHNVDNTRHIIDAYFNLSDMIKCDDYTNSFISMSDKNEILKMGLNSEQVESDLKEYKDSGIVCLEEKDIISSMIEKIKEKLRNEGVNIFFKEDKLELAKKFYDKLGLNDYVLDINRDDEILGDYIWVKNLRGYAGLIISDDGESLICPSIHEYNYWKDEFRKGNRSKLDI